MSNPKQIVVEDETKINELLREIREIWAQYKIEVPKKRRPWPRSVKERIIELWRMGVSTHTIGAETGLPLQTMYSMRQKLKKADPNFLPVPVVKYRRRRNKSLVQLSQLEGRATTVTVVISDRIRVEDIPVEAVLPMIRGLMRDEH